MSLIPDVPRLFIDSSFIEGDVVVLDKDQSHYLIKVLRLKPLDQVLIFNGRDGEWLSQLEPGETRKMAVLRPLRQTRPQAPANDLHYLFAPIKHARLDYMVQKATEMGVSHLRPVHTQYSQSARVNLERMRANAVEAAEQCGLLSVPTIIEDVSLPQALAALEPDRLLIFCDEAAEMFNPVKALEQHKPSSKLAILIGPEGGFSHQERTMIKERSLTLRLSLGPRILRADTAAIAALAVVQAVLGDWR
jgi:16S rRNA (uracil1498-N3)-methyltransferase